MSKHAAPAKNLAVAPDPAYIIQYDTTQIHYSLRFTHRKTLGITVHLDCTVTLAAPVNSAPELVAEKVKQRSASIVKQQRKFERYLPHLPASTSAARLISTWASNTASKSSKRTNPP